MPSGVGASAMHHEVFTETLPLDIVDQLQQSGQNIPWPKRRALVKAVADELERNGSRRELIRLLLLLAGDPKWEVRKDVADCLMLVDEGDFAHLAARLGDDDNAFVRRATELAMDRRRRGRESHQRKRRGLDHVQDQYDRIEQAHGNVAARQAQDLAEQLYDILVGATVHDMRNVLAPLKSAVNSLLGHLADDSLDARYFAKKLTKVNHQAAMIERMLEDMRTYSQATPQHRHRERLADMISEAHGMVRDIFRAAGRDAGCVTAEVDVPEDLTVDVARADMVRALMNLIKNAYESHAIGPNRFIRGSIWVTARRCDVDRIEIIFRDDGMGLSPEELADVRRFVPGGTSKKKYGTGFGLPTAKRKIEAHRGSLAIESKEDEGTTVTVTLVIDPEGGDDEFSCPGC